MLVEVGLNSQNAASVDRTQCLQINGLKWTSVWRSPNFLEKCKGVDVKMANG
ncbi:hypothetical protein BofuT4_P119550.1 [Botrytis cinerea T4]|uniref:Uncharacterized protein n=1 Tax=Botryotinia fuckeliana (strain T4) TaxID=999810 RepID=G2XZY5_BOTF4|nr:hypothetical protein BofuT4_P119550.1 [Botrytis cinerea T4]